MKERAPLLRALARELRALGCEGERLLLAVSGGIDSTVLAHGCAALAPELRLSLTLGHVNHGLRGADSDADEAFVRSLGARLGLPVLVRSVAPRTLRAGRTSRARPTLQEAARRLRYDALGALGEAAGAARIATAHTADDQAETVLLRLFRGTGPAGLGGIPERSPDGRVVRPLLGASRAEIERFALTRGLVWREDASNRDPAYARARLRASGLPELAAGFNPRWLRAVVDLAEAQRRESEWIEQRVTQELRVRLTRDGEGWILACRDWDALPLALSRRLARRVLHEAGGARDLSRVHLDRVCRFLASARTGKQLQLPAGLVLEGGRGEVRIRRGRSQPRC